MNSVFSDLLRSNGLKVTGARIAVMQAVAQQPHCTADDVLLRVKSELGTVSRQTIYDSLSSLADKGVLRRIQPAGSAARYENRVGDNHHHLICRDCGCMFDVDCAVGYRPCLEAANDHGFEIDEAEVIYWGRCPSCVSKNGS